MSTTRTAHIPSSRATTRQTLMVGVGAGAAASLAMAMYAMVASWAKDTGFFTPLFHIASLFVSQDSMMASMRDALAGSAFHLELGPALVGAMIHMMTGAMYGAVFALVASRLSLGKAGLIGAGVAYGAVVFALSSWGGLPVAAAVFDSGDQITDMAEMAGWTTFVLEHLAFGTALGALLALRRTPTTPGRETPGP